jgi:glycosyltransferase involved in cell wall biosynthesis
MSREYDITAVISTFNRDRLLSAALESALNQKYTGGRYEVIVVDNNSTDHTRETVESFISKGHRNLKYVFEPRQGVSYARNTGVACAVAPLIAFADDDVEVDSDWLGVIIKKFLEHPEIVCVGGRVLPRWKDKPPRWLTSDHWSPLALQDYGENELFINSNNPLCLVTANVAFRRHVFSEIGLFEPSLQRVKDGLGSTEDAELLQRLWAAGGECLYAPEMIVISEVSAERTTRQYHRRWHTGHGHFYAMMRSEDMEQCSNKLFDVPSHLFRQAALDALSWFKNMLLWRHDRAFFQELRLRFFLGFFRTRRRSHRASTRRGILGELAAFIRQLVSRRAIASTHDR